MLLYMWVINMSEIKTNTEEQIRNYIKTQKER